MFKVYSASGEYKPKEDLVKNLFKLLCGIQNLKLRPSHPILDRELFQKYLESAQSPTRKPEFQVVDRLSVLANIARRKAFSLDDEQAKQLHAAFLEMFIQREAEVKIIEAENDSMPKVIPIPVKSLKSTPAQSNPQSQKKRPWKTRSVEKEMTSMAN